MAGEKREAEPTLTPSQAGQNPELVEVLSMLRAQLGQLRARYGVRWLGVFGSYVRGEQEGESDLDVLVEFDRVPTLFQFVRLERYLSQQLGVSVDLVMKSALKPTMGRYILEEVVAV